ncbi:MAG: multiheme c-type cytochrome [Isosphaeraceae bacterium]
MSFRALFLSVLVTTALIVSAFLINSRRPKGEVSHASPALVRATGKCAECHRHETVAVVHEFEMSRHAAADVNCLNCHQPVDGQESADHKGFVINKKVTAANCKTCHPQQYDEYLRSRHAAPAWASVTGKADFTVEQVAFAEAHNKGAVDRPPHPLAAIEGPAALNKGCLKCHDIGRPNSDGSIGSCTACHARHVSSVEVARQPETCGACHMGPDHSQLEIYHESKHGVLFSAQKHRMDLSVRPKDLKASDMPVPTCATCHMSGIEGEAMTHDVGSRLSYFLFEAVSERRPEYRAKQTAMKTTCLKCHTNPAILKFYGEAEAVVKSANKLVKEANDIVEGLRKDGLLTPEPLDEPAELLHFDLWHYGGRTAKHGAFMGGADFVQWHGYYIVVSKLTELRKAAADLRREKGAAPAQGESAPAAEAMLNPAEVEWLAETLGVEAGR